MHTANTPSKLSTVEFYKRTGLSTSCVRYTLHNHWNIDAYIVEFLDNFFLLRWNTAYFFKHMQNGKLYHSNKNFSVVYHGTTPEALKNYKKCMLSFRSCGGFSVVLVRPMQETKLKELV
jgi:hypothetical protein